MQKKTNMKFRRMNRDSVAGQGNTLPALPSPSGLIKLIILNCIVLGVVMSFPQACLARTVEYHVYRQATGSDSFDFTWTLAVSENNVLKVAGNGEYYENICDAQCRTVEWRYKTDTSDITAIRDDDVIRIEGTFDNKPFLKGFKIDDHPWYQPLSYSLRCFVDAEERQTVFWMIRPDTLDVIKFQARKLSTEQLIFHDRAVDTVKVELGLTSLLKGLWHAHYWFRQDDGMFIQYRGVHGLPGTPETIVRLIEVD